MNKILIISPHPDDETLGCGGTLLKHKAGGDETFLLIMTSILNGEGYSTEKVREREQEIDNVSYEFGFNDVFKLNNPTTKLDMIPKGQLIKAISRVVDKVMPDIVYVPNGSDIHSDHKITFDAVMSSTKTFRCPHIKKVLLYETVSETEFSPALHSNVFIPNSFSNITEYFERKIVIIKMYKDEIADHPFPRSIDNLRALATFRGATAGVKYAEAFMILKEIW